MHKFTETLGYIFYQLISWALIALCVWMIHGFSAQNANLSEALSLEVTDVVARVMKPEGAIRRSRRYPSCPPMRPMPCLSGSRTVVCPSGAATGHPRARPILDGAAGSATGLIGRDATAQPGATTTPAIALARLTRSAPRAGEPLAVVDSAAARVGSVMLSRSGPSGIVGVCAGKLLPLG